ncbi:MAG: hypothetical protein AVDCRST_MAG11-4046 [uncultured Gemmatimonadaceae bacterium]|uniref:Uncharacterized protein n=1 Tax=uncultured Gemmatimonadaceae bacterium TaxID=246130 RepID=A0A6J4MN68_9BACT|nr:MAG: hypothetical protein AVDCRST_MAG11-4046 [uncultured Gemmatimonadaceae bacterium]
MAPRLALSAALAVSAVVSAPTAGAQAAPAASIPPAAVQVAAAVTPLPEGMRAGATVLGYAPGGARATLRRGTNGMICLADDPKAPNFHVACYHQGLEPFMARGRALRAGGTTGAAVDSVRFAEVASGKLAMPGGGGALYSLTGPAGSFDPATGAVTGARPLHVLYLPNATEASTGMSATPAKSGPWLMNPGTPKAHVMFVGEMK